MSSDVLRIGIISVLLLSAALFVWLSERRARRARARRPKPAPGLPDQAVLARTPLPTSSHSQPALVTPVVSTSALKRAPVAAATAPSVSGKEILDPSARPAPRMSFTAPAQQPPAMPVPPDPHLRQQYDQVRALLAEAQLATQTVSPALHERVVMAAVCQAVDELLAEMKPSLASTVLATQMQLRKKLTRCDARLTSLREHVQHVVSSSTRLADLDTQLRTDGAHLEQQLDTLAQTPQYPVVWDDTGVISRLALNQMRHLPPVSTARDHDDLKRLIHLRRGVLKDIAQGLQAVRATAAQRERLVSLLRQPEFAEPPQWHRGIITLCQRTRAINEAERQRLRERADALLQRRQAWLGAAELVSGAGRLSEQRLPALVEHAEVLQRDIQALWTAARALATKQHTESVV